MSPKNSLKTSVSDSSEAATFQSMCSSIYKCMTERLAAAHSICISFSEQWISYVPPPMTFLGLSSYICKL